MPPASVGLFPMITLGIETSCDETACAVLSGRDTIKSNVVSSSLFRHKPFGGIVPEIASRHCLEQIDFVFKEALGKARVRPPDIDLIAVTQGPGLIGSLLVGVAFAKALSFELDIPLLGVNHLEAHLAANFIARKEPFHYVGLLVSGGHTSLSYHKNGRITMLGSTVDDAAGEAFDKVAKILGLGYPGGPVIEEIARHGNPEAFRFTKPKQTNPFDFSFSGIKTAILYEVQKYWGAKYTGKPGRSMGLKDGKFQSRILRRLPLGFQRDMAASFQNAVVHWLVVKTLEAASFKKVKDVVVGGGVCANSSLREVLNREGKACGVTVCFPQLSLTSDNAAMVARRGIELYQKGRRSEQILTVDPNLPMGR
ncbi:MAG: tRNA (adenosine(37)-N6)-threonylcarbamoyltransferase complex transferase subunit TsaD [Candidatus Omnitrophica bacterium]|nr:tRNA (adenosine(37)-N6)-threonylcarbamoyltransferase complex transferase subunit TsaD [Candidatus Omnitrophota bacterium]